MIKYNKITFLIVPVIVYLILIFYSDSGKVTQNISHMKLEYFLLFVGFWSLGVVSRIFRWNFFIRQLTTEIPFSKNMLYFLSGFAMLLSPGRVGEIIRSPFMKRDYGIPISKTVAIVFVERLYDTLSVVIIITITLYFTELPRMFLVFPLAMTSMLIFLIINKKYIIVIATKLRRFSILKKIFPDIEESFEVVTGLFKIRSFIISSSISLGVVILEAVSFFYLLKSLGITLDLFTLTAIFHTANFTATASMIPGGFGVLEGGLSGLLIMYEVPKDIAFSATILLRIIATGLFSLVGIIAFKIVSKTEL